MALIKSSLWTLGIAFIPVVCGSPCDFSNGRDRGPIGVPVDTAVRVDTAVPEALAAMIESVEVTCNESEIGWVYSVEASGPVGMISMVSWAQVEDREWTERHELTWSFHPTQADWSLFTLSLPVQAGAEWEAGVHTEVPCSEAPHSDRAWVFELTTESGGFGHCVAFGAEAERLLVTFPNCEVWGEQ